LEAIQVTLDAVVHAVNAGRKLVDEKRAVVWNDDQRRKQAGEWGAALEERRRKVEPWVRLNAFIGSADGKAFREIAQQWTLDVLVKHANAQLGQLAARYYLKRLEGCLNLIVVDRQMSDQIRSVHSLSGGESFLVSLGLALGLASLTSSRMRIESLFIDEGFGSLDADTLRTAMDALAHLEAQGRKVGVISHVAEMADAIPVQIRVVKGPGGASRILVPEERV
jgi:exonuclease SbcC